MSRSKAGFTSVSIGKGEHVVAIRFISLGRFPDRHGLDGGKVKLLSATLPHLLGDDVFQPTRYLEAIGQLRVGTCAKLTDHPRAQHEVVAGQLYVSRHILQRWNEELAAERDTAYGVWKRHNVSPG